MNFYRPRSPLCDHRTTIEAYFIEQPPATIKEAVDIIAKLTGIRRSATQVRAFLHSIGMHRRKVGMIPAKADRQQQDDFKKTNLNHGWQKQKLAKEPSFLWMLFTWSLHHFSAFCGALPVSLSKHHLEEAASTS